VTLPRTSPGSVLFTTYNVLDLFLTDSVQDAEHYRQVVASIRELGTDVLAVQEIRGSDLAMVTARLRQLAEDVGMRCMVPSAAPDGASKPALAMGSRGFHCGLLWRGGIEPVPGSVRALGRGHFWHSLAEVTLDAGGRRVRHAAFHATPFGRLLRADQNERLVAMLTGHSGGLPLLVGADWNTESADRVLDEASGRWVLYEPSDPYDGVTWFADMIYQCDWDYDGAGRRRHWVDRRPGDVLWAGGLHDAAAVLRAPWRPTAGHHPDDRYGVAGVSRRIDAIRVTGHLLDALRAYHVTDTELTRQASDHLPVTVEYDPAALAESRPRRDR
jgi:endonuclease/exonuclease/phosphatase family metal-dependent hydrolase